MKNNYSKRHPEHIINRDYTMEEVNQLYRAGGINFYTVPGDMTIHFVDSDNIISRCRYNDITPPCFVDEVSYAVLDRLLASEEAKRAESAIK